MLRSIGAELVAEEAGELAAGLERLVALNTTVCRPYYIAIVHAAAAEVAHPTSEPPLVFLFYHIFLITTPSPPALSPLPWPALVWAARRRSQSARGPAFKISLTECRKVLWWCAEWA